MNEETNRTRSGRIFRSRTARPLWSGLARAGGLGWPKLLTILIAAAVWVASLTAPDAVRAAPLAGAIFTTTPNGAIVNENVRYNQKIEVYLDGGPGPNAPQQAAGLPDGDYVFQVTDPSGEVLLSQDTSRCRVFRVQNGIIVALRDKPNGSFVDHTASDTCHVNDSPEGAAGTTGKHDTNIDADHGGQGAIVVQLMPFFDTPNPGGVYKAWAMPVDRYLANGGNLVAVPAPKCTRHGQPSNCTGNAVQIGFVRDDGFGPPRDQVKTDNFKVLEFVRPLLHVRKFNDLDRDGNWDRGTEPEIGVDQCVDVSGQIVDCTVGGGWPVRITDPLTVTNPYFTPRTVSAEPPGVWTVQEETFASKGWQQTVVFIDGVSQGITNPVNVTVAGTSGEEHEVIFGDAQKPETPRVNTVIHLGSGSGEGTPIVVTGSVPPGSTVHDKATVKPTTKNGTPTGSVTFRFYTGGDCSTGTPVADSPADTKPLVSGVAHPSKDRGPLAAGNYAFKAHFTSGDATKWTDADSDCEPFTVPETPRVNTEIHLGSGSGEGTPIVVTGSVPPGSTVHDKATVKPTTKNGTPTGSVTFRFYTGGDCSTGTPVADSPADTKPLVSGVAHPSKDRGPLAAGNYAFKAHFTSGDATKWTDADSDCEPFTVPETQVTTEIHLGSGSGEGTPIVVTGSVPPGSTLHDKATVSAANGTPTGSVTFRFYTGGDCSTGTPVVDSPADTVALVSGVAHPSKDRGPLAAGDYAFKAHFNSGDVTRWADTDAACEPATVGNPAIVKSPRLANLWLCNQPSVVACANPVAGIGERDFNVNLTGPVTSLDPKCVGFPNFQDPSTCSAQTIGSFEFEVLFDDKFVTVTVVPGALFNRSDASCASIFGQGFVQFRCNIKGKPANAPQGPGTLAVVKVKPTSPVYSILIPNQDNGIVTQLINQNCQISDLQGHPVKLAGQSVPGIGPGLCEAAAVTIRYLEGDVHADCSVDVQDQQQIAFRWGSSAGSLLYNSRLDLEPSSPKQGDGDIDANDLQTVYGRHGSSCADPHPPQPPIDPKAKVG